jgi:hypothetical protein
MTNTDSNYDESKHNRDDAKRYAPKEQGAPQVAIAKFDTFEFTEVGELTEFDENIGGDIHTGPTFSRRFRFDREDGKFAFATASYYVTTKHQELDGDGNRTGKESHNADDYDASEPFYNVVEQTEFLVCSDPDDLGGTEIGSDYDYNFDVLVFAPKDHADAVEMARGFCQRESATNYEMWNGELR